MPQPRFDPQPCHVRASQEMGPVERSVGFLRESFFAAHCFTTLAALNDSVRRWTEQVAGERRWPDDADRTVTKVFAEDESAGCWPYPSNDSPRGRCAASICIPTPT
jgi:hypothetical protein